MQCPQCPAWLSMVPLLIMLALWRALKPLLAWILPLFVSLTHDLKWIRQYLFRGHLFTTLKCYPLTHHRKLLMFLNHVLPLLMCHHLTRLSSLCRLHLPLTLNLLPLYRLQWSLLLCVRL